MLSTELILLKLIDVNGNLSCLVERGFTYGQIAVLIQQQIEVGHAYYYEDTIKLTEKGKQYLYEYFKQNGYKEKESWILPQAQYYHDPISIDEVILPKRL